jgi:hypothetical protein
MKLYLRFYCREAAEKRQAEMAIGRKEEFLRLQMEKAEGDRKQQLEARFLNEQRRRQQTQDDQRILTERIAEQARIEKEIQNEIDLLSKRSGTPSPKQNEDHGSFAMGYKDSVRVTERQQLGPNPPQKPTGTSFGPSVPPQVSTSVVDEQTKARTKRDYQRNDDTFSPSTSPQKKKQVDSEHHHGEKNMDSLRRELMEGSMERGWKEYIDSQFDRVISSVKEFGDAGGLRSAAASSAIPTSHNPTAAPEVPVELTEPYERDLENIRDKRILAKYSTSIEEVRRHLPHYKDVYETEYSRSTEQPTAVACELCTSSVSQNVLNDPKVSLPGKIRMDTSIPIYDNKIQNEEFRKFKSKITDHEGTLIHQRNVEGQLHEEHRPETKEEKQAAKNCARAAYKSIKSHQSQKEYEQELAFLSTVGADVGELNHSRAFSQSMTDSFHSVLKDQASEQLQTPLPATGLPPPVSIVADKVTLNHRTYQIVGVSTIIKGEMTTLYVGMSPVQDHTGAGLASDIKAKVSTIIPTEQLSSR